MDQLNSIKFIFSLGLGSLLLSLHAQQTYFDGSFQKIVEAEKKAYTKKINPKPSASISNYDVKYHRCEWNVDPAVNFIQGKVTTYFKPLTANFDSVLFNLSDTMKVDSVVYHAHGVLFSHSGNIIRSVLPSIIPLNALDSISVFYHGAPDSTGFGSFVQGTHSGTPIIWTLSQPYGASDWWPCKNSLTDKADSIDVIVTAPSAYRAASNGLLVAEAINGANRICHWKHRYPIATYLVCFAVTNYAQYVNYIPFNSTNLFELSYVYPEDSASVAQQTIHDTPIMQMYDTLFGVYPFVNEKYGHVEAGMTMEHQTMTFFCPSCFGFETLAHELAHHWFGDKITCASWEDIWLNEGFASYLSCIAYERMLNGVWWMPFKSSRINSITSVPNGSVWCDDTTSVSRIFDGRLTYSKGAMILHQLRWIIGDSAFFAGINNYLNDPALAYGFAHTSDLRHHFEISSGQNLTWYFNEWYTGQGFPSYQINWNQSGNTVSLSVNQTQSDASVSFFELPLPVEFKNQTRDTIVRLNNTFSGQTYSVTIPFPVDSVKLDPALWLISANNTVSSVNENNFSQQFSVFPNPSKGTFSIFGLKPSVEIRVYNCIGQEVFEKINGTQKQETITLHAAKGVYILKVSDGQQTVCRKIVVQ